MIKDIKRELIKQVTEWTGREPHSWELIGAWYQMYGMSKQELLGALVDINEMLYTRKMFQSR